MRRLLLGAALVLAVGLGVDRLAEPPEELRLGHVARARLRQQRLQSLPRLVTEHPIAGFTEVFELLVLAVPAVAVLVVLAGLRPGDGLAAGDAGHLGPVSPLPHASE